MKKWSFSDHLTYQLIVDSSYSSYSFYWFWFLKLGWIFVFFIKFKKSNSKLVKCRYLRRDEMSGFDYSWVYSFKKIISWLVCRLNDFFCSQQSFFKHLLLWKRFVIFCERAWIKGHLDFVLFTFFASQNVVVNVSLKVRIRKVVELYCFVHLILCYPFLYSHPRNLHFSYDHIVSLFKNFDWLDIGDEILWRVRFSPQFTPGMLVRRFDSAGNFSVSVLHGEIYKN